MASGSASTPSSIRRTTSSCSDDHKRCSAFKSKLPHSAACWAARCNSSLVESLKNCVMSTCSAPRRSGIAPRAGVSKRPPGDSSKNLSKKSSNRLPPPPKGELRLSPLAWAACTSQRCSVLGGSPGTTRLTVTTAGLTPHTSQSLAANPLASYLQAQNKIRGPGDAFRWPPGPPLTLDSGLPSRATRALRPSVAGALGPGTFTGTHGTDPWSAPGALTACALYLDAPGLSHRRSALDGHLQNPVLVPGPDTAFIHAFGQRHAPTERAAPALPYVVAAPLLFLLFPALPADGQHVVLERNVHILGPYARQLGPDHQVAVSLEHVYRRSPLGELLPPLLPSRPTRQAAEHVIEHAVHLAQRVPEPATSPERTQRHLFLLLFHRDPHSGAASFTCVVIIPSNTLFKQIYTRIFLFLSIFGTI